MAEAEAEAPNAAGSTDKRAHAEEVIAEVLKLMGVTARLEVKEVAGVDGAADKAAQAAFISVAIFPEGDAPGLAPGKRSPVADALQFIANKIVNRGQDKKWINLAIGEHPQPRGPKGPSERGPRAQVPDSAAPPAPAQAPAQQPGRGQRQGAAQPAPQPRGDPQAAKPQRPGREPRGERAARSSEETSPVVEDPALQQLGRTLAEKAAQFGRYFGVLPMKPEDRINVMKGAQGAADVTVRLEGEGLHRRVTFHPANPKAMPRKSAMPDYDDEEDVEEE